MPDWKKIKAEYIRGSVSYARLAEKHSVSLSTLKKVASREKWADLKNQARTKTDTKIIESVVQREVKREDKIQTIADDLLLMVGERMSDQEFVKDSKDLRALTAALKDLREIKGFKSELDIQEQIARIDKLKRDAQIEKEQNDIRVVISSDLDAYSN